MTRQNLIYLGLISLAMFLVTILYGGITAWIATLAGLAAMIALAFRDNTPSDGD